MLGFKEFNSFVSAKIEEISWSNWSEWSDCRRLPDGNLVQMRNRSCILQSGLQLSRADPCFLLDNLPNVETIECDSLINFTYFIENFNKTKIVEKTSSSSYLLNNETTQLPSSPRSNISNVDVHMIKLTSEELLTGGGFELSEKSNFLELTPDPFKKEAKVIKINKQPQLNKQGQRVVYDFSKSKFF